MKISLRKSLTHYIKLLLPVVVLILFFAFLYKLYIPRINAFGCFDDCFNFMGGYFISNGFNIYSDFYYNHLPGMAYISALVFIFKNPQSIAELILVHRQFIWLLSLIFSILLYFRFGLRILFVVIFYELIKFYTFGDRFLAESIVSYLLMYQLGVILELFKEKSRLSDFFIMPIASWAILFLREPFSLATILFLIIFSVQNFKMRKKIVFMWGALIMATIITCLANSPGDFIFNVVSVNKFIFQDPILEGNIFRIFKIVLYPLYLFVAQEPWTILRMYLSLFSFVFIASCIFIVIKTRQYKYLLVILLALSALNLRPTPAGTQFYEAFHSNVWILVFLFLTITLINIIYKHTKKVGLLLSSILVIAAIHLIFNKGYFAYGEVNTHEQFFNNFSHEMDVGTAIRNLSDPGDTLFVDGYDDLIIWESKLASSYKYQWYTSFMPRFENYTKERERMLMKAAPTFYYGKCLKDFKSGNAPYERIVSSNYVQITKTDKRGCVLVSKNKIDKIPSSKWDKVDNSKYFLPAKNPGK